MPTVSVISKENPNNIKEFEVESGDLIFDSLDAQGAELPHGCLAGSCGACKCIIIEGTENLSPAGAVELDTIETIKKSATEKFGEEFLDGREVRLSCRSKALGDVKIQPFRL